MGDFKGHVLPGTIFFIVALWWSISIFRRYWNTKYHRTTFISSASYACTLVCVRKEDFPIESVVKISAAVIGILLEIINGMEENGKLKTMGDVQHMTMYACFGVSGIVDLMTYFALPIPPQLDYMTLSLAFMCEGLLFMSHLGGHPPVSTQIHSYIVYASMATSIVTIIEMNYRHNVMAAMLRPYLTLLQGTWFWQVGFILYCPTEGSPIMDLHDHESLMLSAAIFIWHALAVLVLIVIIGIVLSRFHKGGIPGDLKEYPLQNLETSDVKKYEQIALTDSDSD